MSIIAVGSLHGAPGATTLALDLARLAGADSLLIEADPDGGLLAARLFLALKPGLTDLAGAARTGIDPNNIWKYAQPTKNGCAAIVAHPAAEQVYGALRASADHIGEALQALTNTVVLDVGRLRPGSPALALAAYADHTVVVAEPTLESVVALTNRANVLRNLNQVHVVLTGNQPYTPHDVTIASRLPVWGVVERGEGGRRAEMARDTQVKSLLRALSSPFTARGGEIADLLEPLDVAPRSAPTK